MQDKHPPWPVLHLQVSVYVRFSLVGVLCSPSIVHSLRDHSVAIRCCKVNGLPHDHAPFLQHACVHDATHGPPHKLNRGGREITHNHTHISREGRTQATNRPALQPKATSVSGGCHTNHSRTHTHKDTDTHTQSRTNDKDREECTQLQTQREKFTQQPTRMGAENIMHTSSMMQKRN